MSLVRTDTAALRAAAKLLRDEAAQPLGDAAERTARAEQAQPLAPAFDRYGGLAAYQAASRAWRGELDALAAALRQLADALETSADAYDRADADASRRLDPARPLGAPR